jgi:hypothetical protein
MDLLRGLQKQLADLERRAVPRGIRAAEGLRNAGSPVASVRPLMNPVVAAGLSSVGMTANLLSKGAVIPSLIEKTKEVFNPKDNIITTLRNFGTSVENQFAAPGQERRYVGSSPTAVRANRRLDASRPLNAIDTGNSGPIDWNPSANPLSAPSAPVLPPPTTGASQRNYEAEKSRATQLAAQDQLSKKYQVADLTKAYNTAATPEEKEKIGLQIWATTNPELAQKLKPGQTGYSEAISAFQSQSPLGAITKAAGGMQYADLSQKPITTPVGPGGVPFGFSPAQLQTPLTGIEIPPTDKIGVKEFFSDTKPAPGAMEAFTDQMRLFSPEKLDETKRALLIQAFNKGLK